MTPTEEMLIAALGVTWSGFGLSFAIGKWVRGREVATDMPSYRIGQLEKRMDQAGEKMSDLAGDIQGLPDRLRLEFITRHECELMVKRNGGAATHEQ